MPNPRWGDNLLRHLEHDARQRAYRVPRLNGFALATGDGQWSFSQPHSAAWIGVVGSRFDLDDFLDIALREPVPHTRLKRTADRPHPYRYEPWEMAIRVDVRNPRWGNTFKATFHSHELKLRRLKNFRAFLKLLQEAKCES